MGNRIQFKQLGFTFALAMAVTAGASFSARAAEPAPPPRGWSMTDARLIPIQGGGRVKPLDSYAREIVLFETGSRGFHGWRPLDLVLSWISNPQAWQDERFIQVNRADVRRQLVLDEKQTHFTPRELFGNFALLQYAKEMDQRDSN